MNTNRSIHWIFSIVIRLLACGVLLLQPGISSTLNESINQQLSSYIVQAADGHKAKLQ